VNQTRWVDYRHRAYRPVRYLELINGTVALVQCELDDHWRIFTTWDTGLIERSPKFLSLAMSHVAFTEICDRLSAPEKDLLIEELQMNPDKPQYLGDCAVELARLHLADDEKNDRLISKANDFVATHSAEEVELYIGTEIARYKEMRSAEGAE